VLLSSDVLVANVGLHMTTRTALVSNVRAFVAWHASVASQTPQRAPCAVWRETMPQHFPTLAGTYAGLIGFLANASHGAFDQQSYCCTPLPCVQSSSGPSQQPTGAADAALVMTRQKYNDVTDPIVSAAHMPVARVFDLFAPLHYLHGSCHDCTHYVSGHHLASATLASAILGACGRMEEPSRRAATAASAARLALLRGGEGGTLTYVDARGQEAAISRGT
jgi:hypothetical protein